MKGAFTKFHDAFFRRAWFVPGFLFAFVFVLKIDFIKLPPMWDEVFGVFAGADYLAHTGFNFKGLVSSPGYFSGGPNTHALSFLTFIGAGVIAAFGSSELSWLLLHLLQFALCVWSGYYVFKILSPLTSKLTAYLSAFVILTVPVVSSQMGSLYTEIPLMFCVLAVAYYVQQKQMTHALTIAVLSILVKEPGICVLFALVAGMMLHKEHRKKRLAIAISLAAGFALLMIQNYFNYADSHPSSNLSVLSRVAFGWKASYPRFISIIPDVLFVLSIFPLALLLCLRKGVGYKKTDAFLFFALFLVCYLGLFHVAIPILNPEHFMLTRYYVSVIPAIVCVVIAAFDLLIPKNVLNGMLLLWVVLNILNRRGDLYPPLSVVNDFAAEQRSEEYMDSYMVQKEVLNRVSDLYADYYLFMNLPFIHLTNSTTFQYISRPLPKRLNLMYGIPTKDFFDKNDCFFILENYPFLGGQVIRPFLQKMKDGGEYQVMLDKGFRQNAASAAIWKVAKSESICK